VVSSKRSGWPLSSRSTEIAGGQWQTDRKKTTSKDGGVIDAEFEETQ
jgi:hypothetical protein